MTTGNTPATRRRTACGATRAGDPVRRDRRAGQGHDDERQRLDTTASGEASDVVGVNAAATRHDLSRSGAGGVKATPREATAAAAPEPAAASNALPPSGNHTVVKKIST